jgi:hypothetical protein
MHLKTTAGWQISILIFEKKLWRRGLYKYPMKNISRTAKFLIYFSWDIYTGNTFNLAKVGKNFVVLDIFFMGYL